jgi:hypothetical protein
LISPRTSTRSWARSRRRVGVGDWIVLAEAGQAELGGDVGELAGAIVEGGGEVGLRISAWDITGPPGGWVRRWSQRASGQASAGTS